MFSSLHRRYERWRDARAVARRPIDEGLWRRTLNRYPFLQRRDPALQAELRRLTSLFLDRKEFTGVGAVRLTNDVVVAVAAQACLPVLRLGLRPYDGFVGIVVHEDAVVKRNSSREDSGLVHEYDEVLSGEAMVGGPVMLSWRDVRSAGSTASQGYNVVIHEFAHVLDMADGVADGTPPLPMHISLQEWVQTLQTVYDDFVGQVEAGRETVLDPYGAGGPQEFFAVASESFFVAPHALRQAHPELYRMLSRYYLQDPAQEGTIGTN